MDDPLSRTLYRLLVFLFLLLLLLLFGAGYNRDDQIVYYIFITGFIISFILFLLDYWKFFGFLFKENWSLGVFGLVCVVVLNAFSQSYADHLIMITTGLNPSYFPNSQLGLSIALTGAMLLALLFYAPLLIAFSLLIIYFISAIPIWLMVAAGLFAGSWGVNRLGLVTLERIPLIAVFLVIVLVGEMLVYKFFSSNLDKVSGDIVALREKMKEYAVSIDNVSATYFRLFVIGVFLLAVGYDFIQHFLRSIPDMLVDASFVRNNESIYEIFSTPLDTHGRILRCGNYSPDAWIRFIGDPSDSISNKRIILAVPQAAPDGESRRFKFELGVCKMQPAPD